jgi:hypothetical protein
MLDEDDNEAGRIDDADENYGYCEGEMTMAR